jgi:hypothetical protein
MKTAIFRDIRTTRRYIPEDGSFHIESVEECIYYRIKCKECYDWPVRLYEFVNVLSVLAFEYYTSSATGTRLRHHQLVTLKVTSSLGSYDILFSTYICHSHASGKLSIATRDLSTARSLRKIWRALAHRADGLYTNISCCVFVACFTTLSVSRLYRVDNWWIWMHLEGRGLNLIEVLSRNLPRG